MPSVGLQIDWRVIKKRRDEYRKALLEKGVVGGSTKMFELLARKGL